MIEEIEEGLPERGGSHRLTRWRGGAIAKAWRPDFAVCVPGY